MFLAAHGILAKYLYAHPPAGVLHAEAGAQLMYYGGDVLDLILIVVFCRQWYTATDPNPPRRRLWRLPDEIRGPSGAPSQSRSQSRSQSLSQSQSQSQSQPRVAGG
jgi:hypothetical protein